MTDEDIAIKLLAGDVLFTYVFEEYNKQIEVSRSFKKHCNKDLTKIDKHILHKTLNTLNHCRRFMSTNASHYDLKFNNSIICGEITRIQQELNKRTKISLAKPSLKEKRQQKAKENKGHGRSKNK